MIKKIIQVGNRKGGVGKTTTSVNVAWELVRAGYRVLLGDMDSQANGSSMVLDGETPHWLGDVLTDHRFDIRKAIYPAFIDGCEVDGFDVLPGRGGDVMTKLDMEMISLTKREERLAMQLQKVRDDYDFVILDTSPGTSVLGLNAVIAADLYVIPTTYREMSLDGIGKFLAHISDVKLVDEDDIDFLILRTCLKRASKRELAYGNVRVETMWPDNLANTVIYDRAIFGEAELSKMPISLFSKGHEAAAYYKDFTRELIKYVNK
ncbi:ParA family protein [Shewanella algae]|uniref:ParA family protein n=1 Tax=Shewanella algae TaxID=38313 RepID=UPI0016430359|nr:ParA family protein [Shewanella algae]MBO2558983.1 ParA family protein [Shewanella algae]MBO2575863.1 ParA family protein [Shewanella algae]TVO81368.1 hypothetical protein AYI80_21310 [Shewanella algae]TXS81987.1 hypothetical protein AYI81_21270 [Shewanella algae]